jgi:osmoprotectant transport system ATP-binding protein
VIELRNLSKLYGDRAAVDGLDLKVEAGETLVLVGESGSGKTTTLKMINRLIEPSSGSVRIAGRDAADSEPWELRRRIGYAFQGVGLFPHLTVAENIAVTPSLLGWPADRRSRRVAELLERMELDPALYRRRFPRELSGGQAQRVGLARALAAEPEILLLDEPFGALDPVIRDRLQEFFLELRRELGITVVFVTHDMIEALLLGDRIAVLHEGRVLRIDTPPRLLADPGDSVVAGMMDAPRRHAAVFRRLTVAAEGDPS